MRYLYCLIIAVGYIGLPAQVQDVKIMSYNLMYYKAPSAPCFVDPLDPAKDQNFKTVFKAITPDIICVNELGDYPDNSGARSILTNVINTDGENHFVSAKYSNNGSSITNMIFFDSTLFGLQGQSFITTDLANKPLVRVIDFYRLYYKEPGLKLGADTTFITVVAGHLKAGNTSADAQQREDAIEAVMSYLTNTVQDKNVILCGDMNTYGSNEGAYQLLVNYSVAAERFTDPGVAGSWNNNGAYATLHTQSTHSSSSGCFAGGGLDDRFDLMLYSSSIASGAERVKYKFNSLTPVGNDGSHFNQSINAGPNGAVSPAVATALYNVSDHLPLVAEFELTPSAIGLAEIFEDNQITVNNPFDNQLLLQTQQASQGSYTLFISDVTGKPVLKTKWNPSMKQLFINTGAWGPGLYLLQVTHGPQVIFTKKLVK